MIERDNLKTKSKMANKIKIELGGEMYTLPVKCLETRGYGENANEKYINVSHVAASSLVKQFVKKKYGTAVICRVKSSSFSGGNSIDVHICMPDGSPVPNDIYDAVDGFANLWKYGNFNGMIDMYEMSDNSGAVSDNGTTLVAGVKYVHVENRPRFGTPEWIVNEVTAGGRTFEDAIRFVDDVKSVEKAKLELENLVV